MSTCNGVKGSNLVLWAESYVGWFDPRVVCLLEEGLQRETAWVDECEEDVVSVEVSVLTLEVRFLPGASSTGDLPRS